MKIIELRAENFKRLRAVDITPEGHLVEIRGRNGQGKSSVLDGIWALFASADALPRRPVRDGAEQSILRASIGGEAVEYIVTRRISAAGNTSLTVEAPSGARFPSPQRVLDGLIGAISFDPLEFVRAKPRAQLDELRGMVKLDVDVDALEGRNTHDYEQRTAINRDAVRLRTQASGIAVSPDLPGAPINTADLIAELQEAGEHNRKIEQSRGRRETIESRIAALKSAATEKRAQADKLQREAARLDQEADRVESNLRAAAPEEPEPIDTAALAERLREAQVVNGEIAKREQRATLEAEAAALEKRAQALTEAMANRSKEKAEAFARASFPVPGLAFGDGEILFNGVPFEQASQAEKMRVSIAVAIAANPKLRVLCVRDGSLLDSDSWKRLAELVTASDYQCWIEVTDDDGKVGIVIEDGEVRGAPKQGPAENKRRSKSRPDATPDLLGEAAR